MTLHAHMENNAYVMGCLVCGKPYEKLKEETVANYVHQTAEPGETVRERELKCNALNDGLQSGASTFLPRRVSQATACEGQVYTVSYDKTQPGT